MSTGLERHVSFFDQNCDGKITIVEAYNGFRQLKFNVVVAAIGAVAIPFLTGRATGGNFHTIMVSGIHNPGSAHPPNDSGGFTLPNGIQILKDEYTLQDTYDLITARGSKRKFPAYLLEFPILFSTLKKFRTRKNANGKDVVTREELESLFRGDLFFTLTGRAECPLPTNRVPTGNGRVKCPFGFSRGSIRFK